MANVVVIASCSCFAVVISAFAANAVATATSAIADAVGDENRSTEQT